VGRSAEREVLEALTDEEVKQALADLPETFRLAVYLADVEGFAYKEIAEIMDTPVGTVMSRLHRGRKALQKALSTYAYQRGLLAVDPTFPPTRDPAADAPPTGAAAVEVAAARTPTRTPRPNVRSPMPSRGGRP
jgi:RNA polymerase sigma-70 factor, ECF subfamily